MPFSIGETLHAGTYRLDALLEARPWGMTFLATHLSVDQLVVIKTFQVTEGEGGPTSAQIDSFINYAQKLTRFHHPHLSRVSSTFKEDQTACMVSEYIQGEPLSQLIQEKPLEESIALRYIHQIAQGLHGLHRHGLLHLNLHPSRILKRNGGHSAVLIGLNSRFANHPTEQQANPYLAPEQYQSSTNVSLASEIYGVAATLYTLVTGTAPIAASEGRRSGDHRGETLLIAPRDINPRISKPLEKAILSGLAFDVLDRPQRMQDWLKLLPNAAPATPPKTKLQVPSSWSVKLPAFRDAGFKNSVSTVITADPKKTSAHKTTLQKVVPESVPAPDVSTARAAGHHELDAILAELSDDSPPVSAKSTTLQVGEETRIQREVTSSQKPPILERPVGALPSPIVPQGEPPPVVPAPPVPASGISNMAIAAPKKSSRFPKWTLFWCALVAACGGLGAGLWFRVQLAQQFPLAPPSSVEESPLDKFRSLDTKEEKFLPTNSSIIPEEKSNTTEEGYAEPNAEAGLDVAPSIANEDEYGTGLDETPVSPELRESSPWDSQDRAQERLSREQPLEPDLPVVPQEPEFYSPENPEYLEPEILSDGEPYPATAPEDPESFTAPDPLPEEFSDENYTSNSNSSNPNSNTF